MAKYAASTDVSSDRHRAEIEKTKTRYGAQQFMYGWDEPSAIVGFIINGRQVKFALPLPDRDSTEFTRTPTGRARAATQVREAYEQAVRQRWRALALVIKAKLEAVESGIVTFDAEFLAHIVLPNGRTVVDEIGPASSRRTRPSRCPHCYPTTARAGRRAMNG